MKRVGFVIIVVVMMMVLPAGLFAGGNMERDRPENPDNIRVEVSNSWYELYKNTNGSFNELRIREILQSILESQYNFGIYKVTYGTQIEYYSLNDGKILSTEGYNLNEIFNAASEASPIVLPEETLEALSSIDNTADFSFYEGEPYNFTIVESILEGIPVKLDSDGEITFKYPVNGNKLNIDMLLINNYTSTCKRVQFTILSDFFEKESEFFNYAEGAEYKRKAIAFLNTVLGNELIGVFDSLNTGFLSSEINWNEFDVYEGDDVLKEEFRRYQDNFKRSLSQRFNTRVDPNYVEGYRALNITDSLWESIYSDKRNIYISTYLKYLLQKKKPVLSQFFVDAYTNNNLQSSSNQILYDYTNYTIVNEGLARNALRYYTWGVEYTPFSGFNTIVKSQSLNEVYGSIKDLDNFINWIDPEGAVGEKNNNYAPQIVDYSQQEEAPNGTIKYQTNTVDSITLKSTKDGEKINRIDIWSAINLAWEENGPTPIAFECIVSNDGSFETIEDNSIIANLPLSRINDKKIFFDSNENSSANNLLIKRVDVNNNSIGVGYEFTSDDQPVKALLLYKGHSPDNGTEDINTIPTMYNDIEPISVYYWENNGWIKMQPSEYIECVSATNSSYYAVYPSTRNQKPGMGIWSQWFSNGNAEIVSSYLIFNTTVYTKKIMIVDNSDNSVLNVSELAVFSDDPLKMFDIDGTPITLHSTSGAPLKLIRWSTGVGMTGISLPVADSEGWVMNNGNYSDTYTFITKMGDVNASSIVVTGKIQAPVRQVIAWGSSTENDQILVWNNEITAWFGDSTITENKYFYTLKGLSGNQNWTSLHALVDTPFIDSNLISLLGNPLPYAPGGIDSPRTFAYKMDAQVQAGKSLLNNDNHSTKAYTPKNGISYESGYAGRDDLPAESPFKPFRPGYYLNNGVGGYEEGKLSPEQSAGINSVGLLQGVLSINDTGEFVGANGKNLLEQLNAYFGMSTARAPGLDIDKTPVFNADENNSYNRIKRITAADIERSTIIVPDIRDIARGDLLVRYEDDGNVVAGVVVGFLTEARPDSISHPKDWWENVLVVSTRPGFQSVVLGTWGNSGNIFGGFTENPEDYVIRRVVMRGDDDHETTMKTDPNECIESIYHQRSSSYVAEAKAYWDGGVLTGTSDLTMYQELITKGEAMYKELPPTSYDTNILVQSIFDANPADGIMNKMLPTSYSGWRDRGIGALIYHRAVDFVPENNPGGNIGAETVVDMKAPEDGRYWVVDLGFDIENNGKNLYIQIDNENFLILNQFSERIYGDLGILVTNPHNPQKGRIYLFAHMYYDAAGSEGGIKAYYQNNPTVHFKDINDNEIQELPISWDTGGYVSAGDWIGRMAGNPTYGPHVHLEVFEYYPELEPIKLQNWTNIKNALNKQTDLNYEEEDLEPFVKWQRVDARTIFKPELLIPYPDADGAQAVIATLNGLSDTLWGNFKNFKVQRIGTLFKEWTFWPRFEEENDE